MALRSDMLTDILRVHACISLAISLSLGSIARRHEFRFPESTSPSRCFTLPLFYPPTVSPSLREGRKRGFASFRGGALRERGEGREERVESGEERKSREVQSVEKRDKSAESRM